ncbi:hypothetical protein LY78DRAFT_346577 [Colletotrichum sublineola]|nr:hypothetical protein LY78DRAFT_346577 [Colletotrichum sublineola]
MMSCEEASIFRLFPGDRNHSRHMQMTWMFPAELRLTLSSTWLKPLLFFCFFTLAESHRVVSSSLALTEDLPGAMPRALPVSPVPPPCRVNRLAEPLAGEKGALALTKTLVLVALQEEGLARVHLVDGRTGYGEYAIETPFFFSSLLSAQPGEGRGIISCSH